MKQIVLHHTDGTSFNLVSKEPLCYPTSATQEKELNGSDCVKITLVSATALTFYIGDYISIYNKRYTLNQQPTVTKISNRQFQYELNFESVQYELLDVLWFLRQEDEVENDYSYNGLTTDLKGFLDNLIWNANRNRETETWQLGDYPDDILDVKTLSFEEQNCLAVLQSLCEEYNVNFRIDENNGKLILNVFKNEQDTSRQLDFAFSYGRAGGAYQIQRSNIDDGNIITRLYCYGGSENLGKNYGAKKLCLPSNSTRKSVGGWGTTARTVLKNMAQINGLYTWNVFFDSAAQTALAPYIGDTATYKVQARCVQGGGSLNDKTFNVVGTFDKGIVITETIISGAYYPNRRNGVISKGAVFVFYVDKVGVEHKSRSNSYIEANSTLIEKFGIRENILNCEDIFPQGKFTVGARVSQKVIDANIGFNINEYLVEGTEVQLTPQTGNCAGYEFGVSKVQYGSGFNGCDSRITINTITDENGYVFPSENAGGAFSIAADDEFLISGIYLPNEFIENAQNALLAEGEKYLDENCIPKVQYAIEIDRNYMKERLSTMSDTEPFKVGLFVTINDDDLGINNVATQITAITRDLIDDYKFSITVGDSSQKSNLSRIVGDLKKVTQKATILEQTDSELSRLNYQAKQELLQTIFDTEENIYTEAINPLTVQTQALQVGANSRQFTLQNFNLQPNYSVLGSETASNYYNKVYWKSGAVLTHQTILDDNGNMRTWTLTDGNSVVTLNTNNPYYIYAVCGKNGETGHILLSEEKYRYDGYNIDTEATDTSNYYFQLGVLSSPLNGRNNLKTRIASMSYGSTTINGSFIQTGRLSSNNGESYFDLDSGTFAGTIYFKDGLISDNVMVGNSAEDAKAGISGAERTPNYNLIKGTQHFDFFDFESLTWKSSPIFNFHPNAKKTYYAFDNMFTTLGISNVNQKIGDTQFLDIELAYFYKEFGYEFDPTSYDFCLSFYARGTGSMIITFKGNSSGTEYDQQLGYIYKNQITENWQRIVIPISDEWDYREEFIDDSISNIYFYVQGSVEIAAIKLEMKSEPTEWRLAESESYQTKINGVDVPIRFWSGASHRYAAPFKVLQNGTTISGEYYKFVQLTNTGQIQIRNVNNNIVGFLEGGGDTSRPDNLGNVNLFLSALGNYVTANDFFSGNADTMLGAIAAYTDTSDGRGIAKFYADCYEGREMVLDNRGSSHHDTSLKVITRSGRDVGMVIETRGKNNSAMGISLNNSGSSGISIWDNVGSNTNEAALEIGYGNSYHTRFLFSGSAFIGIFCFIKEVWSYNDINENDTSGGEKFWKNWLLKLLNTYNSALNNKLIFARATPNSQYMVSGGLYNYVSSNSIKCDYCHFKVFGLSINVENYFGVRDGTWQWNWK